MSGNLIKFRMFLPIIIGVLFCTPGVALTCASGTAPSPDSSQCLTLCTAGGTKLKTSNGASVNLFATRHSSPSLNITINGTTCYAHLVRGAKTATSLYVDYNGVKFHTFPSTTPGIYAIQIGAYSSPKNAESIAVLASKYGTTTTVYDSGLWKVRIVNLTATTAKTIYNSVNADTAFDELVGTTYTPGLLKDGKWASISSL